MLNDNDARLTTVAVLVDKTMVFLTFRNVFQKEGDWNPANTTNGSDKYHRAFEGNRTNKQTNGTNGSEEGHKGNRVSVMK